MKEVDAKLLLHASMPLALWFWGRRSVYVKLGICTWAICGWVGGVPIAVVQLARDRYAYESY